MAATEDFIHLEQDRQAPLEEQEAGEEDPEEVEEEEEEEGEQEEEEEEEMNDEIPEPMREKRRRKETEVFVGGLHRDATEEDIEEEFSKVGEVVEVRLAKDRYTEKSKGFAFVRFATAEQAEKVANEIKQIVVKGIPCGVIRNKESVTVHIGNICTSWTKDDLVENLKVFDLENLEDVHLIDDPHNRGQNRGYAFLDFSTHIDAVEACSKLRRIAFFFGMGIREDIAIYKTIEPHEEDEKHVKSVFLAGFPLNWKEAQLQEHLKKFGEIESIHLACNMPTAKRKDFAFIYFTTREAALNCIEKVNRDGIGDGHDKIIVKASLKKSLEKRRSSTLGVRGGYIGKRGKPSYGYSQSSGGRGSRSYNWRGRGSHGGFPFKGRGSRGSGYMEEAMSITPRKYGSQFRSGSLRETPGSDTATPSRSRASYYKSGSSSRQTPSEHHFQATIYSQMRRPYADDGYDEYEDVPAYEYEDMPSYDYDEMPAYSYDDTSGYEHSYTKLKKDTHYAQNHDIPVSRSQPRRGRSRSGSEMDSYPEHGDPAYEEDSRFSPNEQMGYQRVEYRNKGYARKAYSWKRYPQIL